MSRTLEQAHLPALARGFSLLGSGGGGRTILQELVLANAGNWPIDLYDVGDLPSSTPCIAAAYVGSTQFLHERLPGEAPFAILLDAAERWSGIRASAVCSAEGAGLNGLTPLLLAQDHMLVDADFMGRALPRLDQMSVFADRLPGLFVICDSGAGGVAVVDTGRPEDIERVVRAAVVQAGGVATAVIGGFTVGALREHAITGTYRRAQRLGNAFEMGSERSFRALAERMGAGLLGNGRVSALEPSSRGDYSYTIEITSDNGDIARIIAGSEALAFMREGRVEATVPEIIISIDSISQTILQVDELTLGRNVTVLSLPAPSWWRSTPTRIGHVSPRAFGLTDMERRP
ncbi:S-methyl thiohydantoin desulfurase domain-containing protein [Arthrobacter pigmenti]